LNRTIDDFRRALSFNFPLVLDCLSPIAFAQCSPWDKEEGYLENLVEMAKLLKDRLEKSTTPQMTGGYSLRIDYAKMHKRIFVDYSLSGQKETCEIGDVLIVSKYVEPSRIVSRHVSFLQVKSQEKGVRQRQWHIDTVQSSLYAHWPEIEECYVGRGDNRTRLFDRLKIQPKNRLFSPYLMIGKDAPFPMTCCEGPFSWITGADLVNEVSRNSSHMRGPLELPFLSFLIQMVFQTSGERDIINDRSENASVRKAVDAILKYAELHDPPQGEGRPFMAISFTLKAID